MTDVLTRPTLRETLARTLAWHHYGRRQTWDQLSEFCRDKFLKLADVTIHVFHVAQPQVSERPSTREVLEAMWKDVNETNDQIVAMPRSLFDHILRKLEFDVPEVPIHIFTAPPELKFNEGEGDE